VAAMEPDAVDVTGSIAELRRRGLIRPTATSDLDGQEGFSFTHGLIRDVTYGQIPRAGRATRHLAAARWLETTAGERVEERAELLAHHTSEALTLSRAAGVSEDLTSLEDDARRFLLMAGDRQGRLDPSMGYAYLQRALELTPGGHPLRSELLRKTTMLGWRSGNLEVVEAIEAYREAIEEALARDDRLEAAQGMRRLYYQLGFAGRTAEARDTLNRAVELLSGEPTPVMAELYACLAEDDMLAGRSEASLRWAGLALELSHTDSVEVMALHIRGNGRCELGDLEGLDDLWTSLRTAEASGNVQDLVTSYSYLDEWVGLTEGPTRGLELNEAALDLCDRRGIHAQGMYARAESMWLLYDAGRWDALLTRADELVDWAAIHGDEIIEAVADSYKHRVLAHRGSTEEAGRFLERTVPEARHHDPQVLAPVLVTAAVVEDARGNVDAALEHVRAFEEATRDRPTEYRELQMPELIRLCLARAQLDLAAIVLGDRPVFVARTKHAVSTGRAALAEAHGDPEPALERFRAVADDWGTYGDPFERAHALAGQGRCLAALGRDDEARAATATARDLFDDLGVA